MSSEDRKPQPTGDRVEDARTWHRRATPTKDRPMSSTCAECGDPWPCMPAFLIAEVDRLRRQLELAHRKPALPEDPDHRPNLPARRGAALGGRLWTTRSFEGQVTWIASGVGELQAISASVLRRATSDVDDALGSPPLEGGHSVSFEEDGSRTGRVPNQALAREVVVQEPSSGREVASWKLDPVAEDAHHFLEAVVAVGDALEAALPPGRRLYGLGQEEAKRLVEPRVGRCENRACRRWCEGLTESDRLIIDSSDGVLRCNACYRYRRRTGVERPEPLCHPDAEVDPDA